LDKLEKLAVHKELNIQDHLLKEIHNNHVLRRKTDIHVLDGDSNRKKPRSRSNSPGDSDGDSSLTRVTKNYKTRNLTNQFLYKGRKQIRRLKTKHTTSATTTDCTSLTEESILNHYPQDIMKALPISNKQDRDKYIEARVKNWQKF